MGDRQASNRGRGEVASLGITMADLTITLPDGSTRTLPEGATGADLAADIGPGLAKAAITANVDGEGRDLDRPLPDGATVAIVTADSDEGLHTLRLTIINLPHIFPIFSFRISILKPS